MWDQNNLIVLNQCLRKELNGIVALYCVAIKEVGVWERTKDSPSLDQQKTEYLVEIMFLKTLMHVHKF